MDYNSNLVRFLILAPMLPECLILWAIFARKRHLAVPWFTIFIFLDFTSAAPIFYIYQKTSPWIYFFASWCQGLMMFSIAFMVIVELFRNLASGFPDVVRMGVRVLFPVTAALVLITALAGTAGSTNSTSAVRILLVLERSITFIQVGALVAMFAFARFLAMNWKHYQFGIGLGFGLYACLKLATLAYVAEVGASAAFKTMVIEQIGYQCTVVLWAIYFLHPGEKVPPPPVPTAIQELDRCREVLSEMQR